MTTMETDRLAPVRDLLGELQRQLETKRDLMADTRRVSFADVRSGETPGADHRPPLTREEWKVAATEGPLALLVDLPDDGAVAFGVTRHAHGQIGDRLGIPWKLYDRLLGTHPDLLAGLANGLLSREPEMRRLRTLDGQVRAFLSDKYRPRDNWDLMAALMPVLEEFPGYGFHRCDLSETQMYVKVVIDEERPLRVGDMVRCGALVKNSEVGAGSLLVAPFTTVLSCLNGNVHTEYGKRRIHVGKRTQGEEGVEAWDLYSDETLKLDDEAFFAKVSDSLRATLSGVVFDRIVAQMDELAEIKVEGSPVAAVEELAKRSGFTEGERDEMLTHLIEGGDLSAWGYVQSVTRTARDMENVDRQVELETLAGRLIAVPAEWVPAVSKVAVAA